MESSWRSTGCIGWKTPSTIIDLEGQARVADALTVPIAAGEYHYGIEPFRYMLERRSIDIVMIDLMRVGGLTRWMKVAHLAEAFNVPVVSHLVPEFLCHAMAAIPNGIYTEYMPWSLPLYKEPPRIEDGELILPQTPGLGLEFDEDAITALSDGLDFGSVRKASNVDCLQ